MSKIFYIADMHIAHKNILAFDKRPFSSIEEHDKVLMDNWNSVVNDGDTVYILGDEHWGKAPEVYDYFKQLKGRKVCIKGNHTLKHFSQNLKNLFDDVRDYKEIKDNGRLVILCHYPILTYKHSYDPNVFMLHGHTHRTKEQEYIEKWTKELRENCKGPIDNCGNIYNVGCMMPYMNFSPQTLDEIIMKSETIESKGE